MNRLLCLLEVSVGGGLLAALTHAVTVGPDADINTLFQPSVLAIASIVGGVAGIVISPLAFWALGGKNLKIAVPVIYLSSIICIALLNFLQVRFSMYIGFGSTVVLLLIYRFIGK